MFYGHGRRSKQILRNSVSAFLWVVFIPGDISLSTLFVVTLINFCGNMSCVNTESQITGGALA
jgi:hypothetical protein